MYELPDLPYAYDALKPVIDETTMKVHHQQHHQGYVDGANEAKKKLHACVQSNDHDLIRHWERELAFHASGHINHIIFWYSMCSPNRSTSIGPRLARQVGRDFGSFNALRAHFLAASNSVEGSGWGMLVWDPQSASLVVQAVENHQDTKITGTYPILCVDVWEHAYYLSYLNDRESYVERWFDHLVNWNRISNRFTSIISS